jgi:uncharacterized protein involved in type VI secretion and phage assembly
MSPRRYFGKYRGTVTDNKDPLGIGRIQPTAPAIAPDALNWAMPCVPYAGPQEGFFMIPPVGANVWIEFEGGDPNYPIWSGCFWGDKQGQKPPTDATGPEIKVLQSEKMVLSFDDKNTKLTAKLKPKADKGSNPTMSLTMDEKEIVLTAKQVTVTITPDRVEIKKGATVIELTDNIVLKKPPASIEISSAITLKNAAASGELTTSAINLKNGAASIAMSPASVNVNNGALEII